LFTEKIELKETLFKRIMSEKERIAMIHVPSRSTISGTTNYSRDSGSTNGGRKNPKNGRRNNKFQGKNRRYDDDNDINDLVNWRTSVPSSSSTTQPKPNTTTTSSCHSPSRYSGSTSSNHSNYRDEKKYPPKSQEYYYDSAAAKAAAAASYQINYQKMSSYSFSIELTEYDFEEIRCSTIHSSTNHHSKGHGHHHSSGHHSHGNNSSTNSSGNSNKIENCLDDELEIYLKAVYAKSEAVLDLHAQHVAIAAERSKQSATERWLLSRTPEERNRYLQSRNMTTQF
jgi:hypothetical protein